MFKIVTVCGNGIGSSLILRMKIEEICREEGIEATVESADLNSALALHPDLIVTVAELARGFATNQEVAIVRSYINKIQIKEDILARLKAMIH